MNKKTNNTEAQNVAIKDLKAELELDAELDIDNLDTQETNNWDDEDDEDDYWDY